MKNLALESLNDKDFKIKIKYNSIEINGKPKTVHEIA